MTQAKFNWTCPNCNNHNKDEIVDSECGPFNSLICDSCGSSSDFSNLLSEDFAARDDAIESATIDRKL